jgi:hypothetical protein
MPGAEALAILEYSAGDMTRKPRDSIGLDGKSSID